MAHRMSVCAGAAVLALGAAMATGAQGAVSISSYKIQPLLHSYTAFDPGLGTLQSVRFELAGNFAPQIISDSTGVLAPLFVQQSIERFDGRGFATITSPFITGQILTTGPGVLATAIAPFHNVFTFNAQSELTGFAQDSYGTFLSGRLADFLAGGLTGDQILQRATYSAFAQGSDTLLPSVFTFAQGGGTVTYTYTPAPAAVVPEPGAWALMLAGFGLAGAILRRRRPASVMARPVA